MTVASSLTTALRNKISIRRLSFRDVVNFSAPSESKGSPPAMGADPARPVPVAVPYAEGKGPAPSRGPVEAVGAEPAAVL